MVSITETMTRGETTSYTRTAIAPNEFIDVRYNGQNRNEVELDPYILKPDGSRTKFGLSMFASSGWLQKLGLKQTLNNLYQVTITGDLARAIKVWPRSQVNYIHEDIEDRLNNTLAIQPVLEEGIRIQHEYKNEGKIPDCSDLVLPSDPTLQPKNHQLVGIKLGMQKREGYLYLMDMGTGKTPTTILAILNEVLQNPRNDPYKVLVILPPALVDQWASELARWAICPITVKNLTNLVYKPGGKSVEQVMSIFEAIAQAQSRKSKAIFFLATYDGTVTNGLHVMTKFQWDFAVADEIQLCKDSGTKRTKAMLALRDYVTKRFGLTGTPVGNSINDLYPLLEWVARNASGHSNPTAFKTNYTITKKISSASDKDAKKKQGVEKIIGSVHHEQLKLRLAEHSFSVLKAEVLPDLPGKTYEIVTTKMTDSQSKAYRTMATNLVIEINNSGTFTEHVLTKLLRLGQVTSGFIPLDYGDDDELDINDTVDDELDIPDGDVQAEEEVITPTEAEPDGNLLLEAALKATQSFISDLSGTKIQAVPVFGDTQEGIALVDSSGKPLNNPLMTPAMMETQQLQSFAANARKINRKYNFFENNDKLKVLKERFAELPQNEKMVIWNIWIPGVGNIVDALKEDGHDVAVFRGNRKQRNEAKERFTYDRNCRIFLCHPQSGGAGLNLLGHPPELAHEYDTDTTLMVYFGFGWSLFQRLQSEDRANRIGSRKPLHIVTLLAKTNKGGKTIDHDIFDVLTSKQETAETMRNMNEILAHLNGNWE